MLDPAPPLEQSPAARRILPVERIAALVEVILCSGLPTQILVGAAMIGFGVPSHEPEGLLSPRFVIVASLIDAVLVIGLVFILLRAHRESVRDVLIGRRRLLREVAFGLALIPLVFMLVVVIMGLVIQYAPYLRNVPENPLTSLLRRRDDAIVFGFVVMFAGGVREEIQRGFIVHRFDGYLGGGLVGVIAYSALFGALHLEQGWDASLATGALGATWGLVYLRRRSIVAPVVSHAGFNLAQVIKAVLLR